MKRNDWLHGCATKLGRYAEFLVQIVQRKAGLQMFAGCHAGISVTAVIFGGPQWIACLNKGISGADIPTIVATFMAAAFRKIAHTHGAPLIEQLFPVGSCK